MNRVESVPCDADVKHVDELSEGPQTHLARLVRGDDVRVEREALAELCGCDVIKFTDYVEVTAEPDVDDWRSS